MISDSKSIALESMKESGVRRKDIYEQMDIYEKLNVELYDLLAALDERLSPVLGMTFVVTDAKESEKPCMDCSLAETLSNRNIYLRSQLDKLAITIDKIKI